MSIADQITRIRGNISNAYDACNEKGATLPAVRNSANLAATITSIKAGGTGTIDITTNGMHDVSNYASANVNVAPELQEKTATTNGEIIPDDGYYGLSKVTVNVSGGSSNFVAMPRVIKDGVLMLPDATYIFKLPDSVTDIGYRALYGEFLRNVEYEDFIIPVGYADLSSLRTISGNEALVEVFAQNTSLATVNLSNLITISGEYALQYAFYGCSHLSSVDLSSLRTISGSYAMSYAFNQCTSLTELSFPELIADSFGSYTTQFNKMLQGVSGCTVHFPKRLEDVISSWADVISGFGGTDTIVLFDLHAAILNFITEKTTCIFSTNGKPVTGSVAHVGSGTTKYTCYDSDTNVGLIASIDNLEEDKSYDIDIDTKLTEPSSKITISTGISGLGVYFNINGLNIQAVEEATGNYVVNLISNGDEITYNIDGGDSYTDAEGSFITDGTDKTFTHTLSAASWVTFTRPDLTANGTLGGDSFAVSSSDSKSGQAYNAFDDRSSTYIWFSDTSKITFYNPKKLKVSSLIVTYTTDSATYQANTITVQGSNDDKNWTDLGTFSYESGISRTLSVNSSVGYKYHKLTLTPKLTYIRITNIDITAQYKE